MTKKISDSVKLQWLSLIGLAFGYSMVYLDMSAINVALETIKTSLCASNTQLFWVINSYLLSLSVFCLAGGRIGDIFGVRRCFLVGVVIFSLASVGCALAHSVTSLIVYRALQGVGAAVILPIGQASLYHIFPPKRRGKAMGIFGISGIIFIVSGPAIGGLFTEFSTWRWIFGINPFLGVISFAFVWFLLQGLDQEKEEGVRFDFVGQLLILGVLVPLVLAIMQGQSWGWASAIIICLFSMSALFLVAFILYEKKRKTPLVEVKLFKKLEFSISGFNFMTVQFCFILNVFYALYLEKALGFSPFEAGIALLPGSALSLVANPIAGALVDKLGSKFVLRLGLIIIIAALLWLSFMAHLEKYYVLLIPLILISIGGPFAFLGNFMRFMNIVPKTKQGMAAGVGMTIRQIGGALGIALLSLIILVYENRYVNILSPSNRYTKGFSLAVFFVVCSLVVSFMLTFFLDRKDNLKKDLTI